MARCDVCGNDYDKAFQVTRAGRTLNFDSFECAIHAMPPLARIVTARLSGTESRREGRSIAALIARDTQAERKTARSNRPSLKGALRGISVPPR